jgi:hypothetical protein
MKKLELITVEKRGSILLRMRLECLRMNELLHHHAKTPMIKNLLQDYLQWMHHQIKFYTHEENLFPLVEHYNWMVTQFNQHLNSMNSPISYLEL